MGMKLFSKIAAAGIAAFALAGCSSFTPMQTSLFTDEDGNIISVEYGRAKNDHETKFTAPNGKVMTMKSKLAVRVTLPDGDDFVAWTMYRSDNERWMYHANGISCRVFESAINPEGKSDYLLVFEGIICEGPKKGEM